MPNENKDAIRRLFRTINEGDLERLADLLSDDLVEHEEFPGLEPTKEGVLEFFAYLRSAFPDLTMTAHDMIAEDDKVFVRGAMTGTHRGEFMEIPGTGNRIEVPFGDFFRLEDGKIAEHWGVTDTGAMLQQLGALEG